MAGEHIYLNYLNDDILAKKYSAEINTNIARQVLYDYGLPGENHDQALFPTTFLNTRAMILTRSLRSIIENSKHISRLISTK